MSIGASLFLIAAGAILKFAINVNSSSVSIPTIGVILMIVGGLGLIISLLFLLQADRGPVPPDRRDPYDRRPDPRL